MNARPVSALVIEDAPEFRELITSALENEGFQVESSADGDTGVTLARAVDPDIVILDLTLPGLDGIEVCRQLRTFTDAYIIMVTGRDDEVDRLVGLAVGADDYVTKPFSIRELMARVHAVLRRPRSRDVAAGGDSPSPESRTLADMTINLDAREVRVDGQIVPLTKIEFDLLAALTSRPAMVFTREMLLESVWGPHWVGDNHVVDVHIANIRKKIDSDGRQHIATVRGVGYRFVVTPTSTA